MIKLIIRRLLLLVVQMLILSFVLFFLMHPGWSFQYLISWYWNWLVEIVTNGNFGYSWRFRMSAMTIIGNRLPNTLRLLLVTVLITYGIGIPLGIISGRSPNSWKDRVIQMGTQIGASFPSFTLAYVLLIFFAWGGLRWFPARGSISVFVTREAGLIQYYISRLQHIILPAFSLAIIQFVMPMKYLRGGIIDTMKQQFITLARSKGVRRRDIFKKHVFRYSLPSIIATFPLQLVTIISGAIIIERIFAFPGIGGLLFSAFLDGDINLVMSLALIFGVTIMLLTIITDVLIMKLDPRIEFESE